MLVSCTQLLCCFCLCSCYIVMLFSWSWSCERLLCFIFDFSSLITFSCYKSWCFVDLKDQLSSLCASQLVGICDFECAYSVEKIVCISHAFFHAAATNLIQQAHEKNLLKPIEVSLTFLWTGYTIVDWKKETISCSLSYS